MPGELVEWRHINGHSEDCDDECCAGVPLEASIVVIDDPRPGSE